MTTDPRERRSPEPIQPRHIEIARLCGDWCGGTRGTESYMRRKVEPANGSASTPPTGMHQSTSARVA